MKMIDAQAALGFVVSQTSHIETQVYNVQYPDIQYPGLIPVDTSAGDWAKSVTNYSSDKHGAAGWINGNADDVPLAGTSKSKFEAPVWMAGIGYSYGLEEINHAVQLGINLPADDAMAARRAYEEFVDGVALTGDTGKNVTGLFNSTAVPQAAATTGTWSTATADQILGDVNDAIALVHSNTNTVAYADTLLLPYTEFNRIATKRLGADMSMTVLDFLRQANLYTATTGQPLLIRGMRGLDTAGTSANKRMIAYRRSPEVLKLHIPMPHRFLPVFQPSALRFEVPGIFRLGGLDIRLPREMAYIDGL